MTKQRLFISEENFIDHSIPGKLVFNLDGIQLIIKHSVKIIDTRQPIKYDPYLNKLYYEIYRRWSIERGKVYRWRRAKNQGLLSNGPFSITQEGDLYEQEEI